MRRSAGPSGQHRRLEESSRGSRRLRGLILPRQRAFCNIFFNRQGLTSVREQGAGDCQVLGIYGEISAAGGRTGRPVMDGVKPATVECFLPDRTGRLWQDRSSSSQFISSTSISPAIIHTPRATLLPPALMSSSSTTACSRSPSPATPDASDTLDPAVTQEVVDAWCHSLSPDSFVGPDSQYETTDKEANSLELDDLIQDDAYEECAPPFLMSSFTLISSLFSLCPFAF